MNQHRSRYLKSTNSIISIYIKVAILILIHLNSTKVSSVICKYFQVSIQSGLVSIVLYYYTNHYFTIYLWLQGFKNHKLIRLIFAPGTFSTFVAIIITPCRVTTFASPGGVSTFIISTPGRVTTTTPGRITTTSPS